MSEPTGSERRREPRIHSLNLVNVEHFDPENFSSEDLVGRTLDISHRGIRLELFHALPLRTMVSLSLALGSALVEVHGKVVYLEALDEHRCTMGIEFTNVDDQGRAAIDQHVEKLKRHSDDAGSGLHPQSDL